jgi:hypothetical protein
MRWGAFLTNWMLMSISPASSRPKGATIVFDGAYFSKTPRVAPQTAEPVGSCALSGEDLISGGSNVHVFEPTVASACSSTGSRRELRLRGRGRSWI